MLSWVLVSCNILCPKSVEKHSLKHFCRSGEIQGKSWWWKRILRNVSSSWETFLAKYVKQGVCVEENSFLNLINMVFNSQRLDPFSLLVLTWQCIMFVCFFPSLFDDGLQRYQKLSCNIRKFMICQMGMAVFKV